MYRLHIFPNQEIAKAAFRNAKEKIKDWPDVTVRDSELRFEGQGITMTFRGSHDLETYLRGRPLDRVVVDERVKLTRETEDLIRIALLGSKVLKPFEFISYDAMWL